MPNSLLDKIHSCTICAPSFKHEPRPVLSLNANARILIIGQAPGRQVHLSGIPWDDASGDRLRSWLNLSKDEFYNAEVVSIMPMAFCYPGTGKSGDLPPPKICATTWHDKIFKKLKKLELIILVGSYAVKKYWPDNTNVSLASAVKSPFKKPFIALPHPSPRNIRWFKQNPWFHEVIVPNLKEHCSKIYSSL